MAVGVGVSGMPLKGGHGMGVRLPHAGTPLVGQAVRSAIADARSRRPDRREQPDAASARICVRRVCRSRAPGVRPKCFAWRAYISIARALSRMSFNLPHHTHRLQRRVGNAMAG